MPSHQPEIATLHTGPLSQADDLIVFRGGFVLSGRRPSAAPVELVRQLCPAYVLSVKNFCGEFATALAEIYPRRAIIRTAMQNTS